MRPQDPPAFAALEWPGDVREFGGGAAAVWPWLLLAFGLALGCAFVARRRRAVAMPAPGLAPVATALARLQVLAVPAAPVKFAAFCAELKALLRLHGRERFGLATEAATSEELLLRLPSAIALRDCFATCDHVLFAAATPSRDALAASRAAAIAFVTATGAGA
jgi:hypothetical protein